MESEKYVRVRRTKEEMIKQQMEGKLMLQERRLTRPVLAKHATVGSFCTSGISPPPVVWERRRREVEGLTASDCPVHDATMWLVVG